MLHTAGDGGIHRTLILQEVQVRILLEVDTLHRSLLMLGVEIEERRTMTIQLGKGDGEDRPNRIALTRGAIGVHQVTDTGTGLKVGDLILIVREGQIGRPSELVCGDVFGIERELKSVAVHIGVIGQLVHLSTHATGQDTADQVKTLTPVEVTAKADPITKKSEVKSCIELILLLPSQLLIFQLINIGIGLIILSNATIGPTVIEDRKRVSSRSHRGGQSVGGTQQEVRDRLVSREERLTDIP